MATDYYNLPTVNDTEATFSFVDAINALAVATDANAETIRKGFRKDEYVLPTATKQQLGGVRIGDGLDLYSDGMIRAKETKYTLPIASDDAIGGIIAGENIICDPATGTISIDEKAYNFNEFSEEQMADDCVSTAKLRNNSVAEDKLSTAVWSTLSTALNVFKNPVIRKFKVADASLYDGYSLYICIMSCSKINFLFVSGHLSAQWLHSYEATYPIAAAADGTTLSQVMNSTETVYTLAIYQGSNSRKSIYADGNLKYAKLVISPGDSTVTVTPYNDVRDTYYGPYFGNFMPFVKIV